MTAIGIGMIGTGWMARAHTRALRNLTTMLNFPVKIELVGIAGRNSERTTTTAQRWGFREASTDWRSIVDHPDVNVVVNLAANDIHAAPSVSALNLDKHVLCEKPLAIQPDDIANLLQAASSSQCLSATGYNYRFVPAVRVLRDLVKSGRLGTLQHISFGYEQDWAGTTEARSGWRFDNTTDGSCVYDFSHILDLLRWIVGEPAQASGVVFTLDHDRLRKAVQGVDPEDSFHTMVEMKTGETAFLHASRVATGRKGRQFIEITGSRGAVTWDMEELNHLHVYFESDADSGVAGFRKIMVTEPNHPFQEFWYAPGHGIGWDDTVTHQWISFLCAVTGLDKDVPTDFATFEDGTHAVRLADAIRASSRISLPVIVR